MFFCFMDIFLNIEQFKSADKILKGNYLMDIYMYKDFGIQSLLQDKYILEKVIRLSKSKKSNLSLIYFVSLEFHVLYYP